MNRKKTMTPAALEANRQNARKSTGPRDPAAVKFNSVKNGFTSKSLFFEDEKERKLYEEFSSSLRQNLQPRDFLQEMLVEDAAVSWWKLRLIDGLLVEQIRSRAGVSMEVYNSYLEARRRYEGPTGAPAGLQQMVGSGWECQQVVLSTGGSEQRKESTEGPLMTEDGKKKGNGSMQVRFASSEERLLRYANAWRRDFYRALGALLAIQSSG